MAHTVMHSGCVTTATGVYFQKVHKRCQPLSTHLVHCTGHNTLIGPNFLWVENTFILADACRHFFHTVQRPCLQGIVAFSFQSLSAFKTGLRWIYLFASPGSWLKELAYGRTLMLPAVASLKNKARIQILFVLFGII